MSREILGKPETVRLTRRASRVSPGASLLSGNNLHICVSHTRTRTGFDVRIRDAPFPPRVDLTLFRHRNVTPSSQLTFSLQRTGSINGRRRGSRESRQSPSFGIILYNEPTRRRSPPSFLAFSRGPHIESKDTRQGKVLRLRRIVVRRKNKSTTVMNVLLFGVCFMKPKFLFS